MEVVIDGLDEFVRAMDQLADFEHPASDTLRAVAGQMIIKMKELVRVRTGALRNSIRYQFIAPLEVRISMLPHGRFLEFGTSRMPPYPFITPAVQEVCRDFKGIFENYWLKRWRVLK